MSLEIVLILTVVAVSFFVKALAGFGGPLLAVPALAPFVGVEHAVVVVSIANITANLMLLWSNRHAARSNRRLLTRLLIAGAIGTVVGTVLLTKLDERLLSFILAGSVFTYIGMYLAKPTFQMSRSTGEALAMPVGAVGGLFQGATGNSGMVFGTFYHSMGLPRDEFVFALTITFLGFGSLQVATLVQLGSFQGERITEALLAIVPVLVVTPLGEAVSRRLHAAAFARIVLALLAFSAVAVTVSAII